MDSLSQLCSHVAGLGASGRVRRGISAQLRAREVLTLLLTV